MKRFLISASVILLLVESAWASAELVKQKAKQQRDINNQQQGIAPAAPNTQPGPGSYQAAATPQPTMDPAQQALISHIENDLMAIKAAATPEQRLSLQNDLSNLAKHASKPTKPELAKLATDLSAALAGKTVPTASLGQLARDINIVENCDILTLARTQPFISDAQTILKNATVTDENILTIGADLKAIVTEIQKSKPKLYQ